MVVILSKLAIAIAVTCLAFPVLRSPFHGLSERAFLLRILALQVLIEAVLFTVLYGIGGQEVPSDVPAFYLPAARHILAGEIPFRDFSVSYGPFFPYVAGALVYLWDSGKAFVLFAILINAIALPAWHRAALHLTDPTMARRASILYATNGHLAYQVMLGTNQVWISAGLALSAWLLLRNRSVSSGLLQALTASVTKFLTLLYWPVLWICAPQRIHWLIGTLVLFVIYGAFASAGGDILYPIRHEGELISSGNLPYLLAPLLGTVGLTNPQLLNGVALVILVLANLWLFMKVQPLPAARRPALLFAGFVLVGSIFMLVSKKSFTSYALFFMYPALVMLLSGLRRARAAVYFLVVFNAVLVLEPTLWFRFGASGKALQDWIPHAGPAPAAIFLASELVLLGCYAYLAMLSVAYVRRHGGHPVSDQREGAADNATNTALVADESRYRDNAALN